PEMKKKNISAEIFAEFDEFLQAPEAAFETAQQKLCKLVLGSFQILQQNSDHLDYGQDQGSKSQRSCKDGTGGYVFRFVKSPVVGSKCSCQCHLSKCGHKVCTPEKQEDVVELQPYQVLVVGSLPTIEGKQAHGVRTLRLNVGCAEVLRGRQGKKCWKRGVHMCVLTAGSQFCLLYSQAVSLKTL
uniref:Uncharacterized protein n=1 Tax=Denticeps clupeoides TaxID=299321 RepID=A0AAY4DQT1_9TELE